MIGERIDREYTKTILYEVAKEPVVIADYSLYSKRVEAFGVHNVKDLKKELYYVYNPDGSETAYRLDENLTPYAVEETEAETSEKYIADDTIFYYVNADGELTLIDALIRRRGYIIDGDKAYYIDNENDLYMAEGGETTFLYSFPVDPSLSNVISMELLADKYLFVSLANKKPFSGEYDSTDYFLSSDFTDFVNIDDIS
jgi:hypothetical protein